MRPTRGGGPSVRRFGPRWLLTAVGTVVFGTAIATLWDGSSPAIPIRHLAGVLGNDYFLTVLVGLLALAIGARLLASGRQSRMDQAEMPDPEGPPRMPTPGDEFDDVLGDPRILLPIVGRGRREDLRDRLVAAAISTVHRIEGCSEADATRRVESGTWPADPAVTRYLARPSAGPSGGGWSVGARSIRWRARQAVDAIERYGTDPGGGDP